MAFDTRYRPLTFAGVIGQEGSVQVLRQFVRSGTGFHQSYVFAGHHGSGKTTLGRILARALLCEAPVDGNPCDQCDSCRSILERGSAECFVEFDAATNSGKDSIRAIVDTLQYDTFSGKRRIYLMDESHRLSKDALDALLKPMEDSAPGSEDKLLVCIFCTTEPEKMRSTVFSRCAPAFVIRKVSPDGIADRLTYVCQQEGLEFEREALVLIAEATDSHIRDALKALEGVSMLGPVNVQNARQYLRLDVNGSYLDMLEGLGSDLPAVLLNAETVLDSVSPSTAYERLAEAAMLAYRLRLGVAKPPSYWPTERLRALADKHGDSLVKMADTFASRPGNPVAAMLSCDLAVLHHTLQGTWSQPVAAVPAQQKSTATIPAVDTIPQAAPVVPSKSAPTPTESPGIVSQGKPAIPKAAINAAGVFVDPRAVGRRTPNVTAQGALPPMDPEEFGHVLRRLLREQGLNVGASSEKTS